MSSAKMLLQQSSTKFCDLADKEFKIAVWKKLNKLQKKKNHRKTIH